MFNYPYTCPNGLVMNDIHDVIRHADKLYACMLNDPSSLNEEDRQTFEILNKESRRFHWETDPERMVNP